MSEEKADITIERVLNAPVDLVWRALTDIELLKKWSPFFSEFKPEVGFKTSFLLGPADRKYMHRVEVKSVEAGKSLSHTWQYDDYPGQGLVTYNLEAQGEKTKVTLSFEILEAFPSGNDDFSKKSFTSGWTYGMNALEEFVTKETK